MTMTEAEYEELQSTIEVGQFMRDMDGWDVPPDEHNNPPIPVTDYDLAEWADNQCGTRSDPDDVDNINEW